MQENAMLAKQIALCVEEKIELQKKLASAHRALDSARRELQRQRETDTGIFAAKVKAEEALSVSLRSEKETRLQLCEARREVERLRSMFDKYEQEATDARAEVIRAESAAASARCMLRHFLAWTGSYALQTIVMLLQ